MNQNTELDNESFQDEIELKTLVKGIYKSKNFIIIITLIGAISSVLYALSLQNVYQSETSVVIDNKSDNSSNMSQFSGLASMAGINLNSSSDDRTDEVIELMTSKKFVYDFVQNRDLYVPLLAFKELNPDRKTYKVDENIYDIDEKNWIEGAFNNPSGKPTYEDVYEEFGNLIGITKDFETGFISISFKHRSPFIALQVLDWFVEDVNANFKSYDIKQSEKALKYLEEQLIESNLPDIDKAIISLIQEELSNLMLINIRDQYILRTLDPPLLAIKKSEPSRASICIIITTMVFILSLLFISALSFFNKAIVISAIPPKFLIEKI